MKDIEKIYKILDHFHKNPQITQRDLVEDLDLSLGKVNFLISSLVNKGLIKLERFKNSRNKRGYLYLLTPKGLKEKTIITKKFLQYQLEEYERLKERIDYLKKSIETG
ncbi:MAG: MarR family EPS-associated transcriptional regulator [Candidatus Lokiarchaeota archaeon]|nr:MarR family EPS-associated transcriptional regulator [Candidatus Lokiarchaeota archaeon]